jgi:starch synthase (maltosyl-transferring)
VRIVIENVTPQVDGGRFAVKAVAGDTVEVAADIWKDGPDLLKAAVIWRKLDPAELRAPQVPLPPDLGDKSWRDARLHSDYACNDRWFGQMPLDEAGPYAFSIVAWTDVFGSWREEPQKKRAAGQEVSSELLEGIALIEQAARTAREPERQALPNAGGLRQERKFGAGLILFLFHLHGGSFSFSTFKPFWHRGVWKGSTPRPGCGEGSRDLGG